jgi:hypothetical protein
MDKKFAQIFKFKSGEQGKPYWISAMMAMWPAS